MLLFFMLCDGVYVLKVIRKNIFNVGNSWKLLVFEWVADCCVYVESKNKLAIPENCT